MEISTLLIAKIGVVGLGFSLAYAWRIWALNELSVN